MGIFARIARDSLRGRPVTPEPSLRGLRGVGGLGGVSEFERIVRASLPVTTGAAAAMHTPGQPVLSRQDRATRRLLRPPSPDELRTAGALIARGEAD
jgi:hypothetical protein